MISPILHPSYTTLQFHRQHASPNFGVFSKFGVLNARFQKQIPSVRTPVFFASGDRLLIVIFRYTNPLRTKARITNYTAHFNNTQKTLFVLYRNQHRHTCSSSALRVDRPPAHWAVKLQVLTHPKLPGQPKVHFCCSTAVNVGIFPASLLLILTFIQLPVLTRCTFPLLLCFEHWYTYSSFNTGIGRPQASWSAESRCSVVY